MSDHQQPYRWHSGQAAKQVIDETRLSVERFCERVGIARATLYLWYKQAEWDQKRCFRAAAALGIRWQWLMRGEGPMRSTDDVLSVAHPRMASTLAMFQEQVTTLALEYTQRILHAAEQELRQAGVSLPGVQGAAPIDERKRPRRRGG